MDRNTFGVFQNSRPFVFENCTKVKQRKLCVALAPEENKMTSQFFTGLLFSVMLKMSLDIVIRIIMPIISTGRSDFDIGNSLKCKFRRL